MVEILVSWIGFGILFLSFHTDNWIIWIKCSFVWLVPGNTTEWLNYLEFKRKVIKVHITPCISIMPLETRITTSNLNGISVYPSKSLLHYPFPMDEVPMEGVHNHKVFDIYQLSDLSLTLPNRNNAYISRNKYMNRVKYLKRICFAEILY